MDRCPVLLIPQADTKRLKSRLDAAGLRDKTKLLSKYDNNNHNNNNNNHNNNNNKDDDLTGYMAMALIPIPALQVPSSLPTSDGSIVSLSSIIETLQVTDPSNSILQAFNNNNNNTDTKDTINLQKIFVTWFTSLDFKTPKHLLVKTPYETLYESISIFLKPILESWDQEEEEEHEREEEAHGCSSCGTCSSSHGHDHKKKKSNWLPDLLQGIPQKWEHYSDFTLLPPTAFLSPEESSSSSLSSYSGASWTKLFERLEILDLFIKMDSEKWMTRFNELIQKGFQSTHVARKGIMIPIQDILRRPKIRPLTGDWGLEHDGFKTWREQPGIVGFVNHREVETVDELLDTTASIVQGSSSSSTTTTTTTTTRLSIEPEEFVKVFWSMTCQNHVWYCWAPIYTMFSAGNISEKERVAHSRPIFDAKDKVVVDLYAGIGYFSLVYLIHSGAKIVHGCEWNPWSVEGLRKGAEKNGIDWSLYEQSESKDQAAVVVRSGKGRKPRTKTEKKSSPTTLTGTTIDSTSVQPLGHLHIYPGDNAQWIQAFENSAHHVNLGLIPSSEQGWPLAVRALCPKEGGYLHVHQNIKVGEEDQFKEYLIRSLKDLFKKWKPSTAAESESAWSIEIRHMENVKSFAPLVHHYVADVECRPLF